MSRIATFTAWLVGATITAAGYWYAVIYVLGEFNHGYGRDNWFLLNLYLSALSIVAGLVGFAGAAIFRPPARAFLGACLAGVAFTVAEIVLVFAFERAFPDLDTVGPGLAGALVIGALSSFLLRPRAV